MEETTTCQNCILLSKQLKMLKVLLVVLIFSTILFGVILPFLRSLGEIPGGQYQIAYSISPDNNYYAMNVYAINTKGKQYEIHADVIVGAYQATSFKIQRSKILGTTSSLYDAVIACNTVKWLDDRVIVTPGLNGKEYSLPKSIYTDHR